MPSGVTKPGLELGVILDQFPGGLLILLAGAAGERLWRKTEEAEERLELAFLVPFQILVEDLGPSVPAEESSSSGETPLPLPDVGDRLLVLDPEWFVSDGGRAFRPLPSARSHGELQGEQVSEEIQARVHFLDARAESGHIVDRKQAIRDLIAKHPGQPLVGNLVFGSKSGIKDDLAIIDEFREGVMWVVDMCQFRTDRTLIHDLIGKGVMIMVTGSKFYQAPPFCGALLVPKQWTAMLATKPAQVAKGFEHLFTAYDFPTALPAVREQLPAFKNVGLRLRWEIALREMEAYMAFSQDEANGLIRRWSQVVTGRLAQSDYFRLMPNIELTNDSIVSFMVLVQGRALNNAELKKLFDSLVLSRHEGLRDYDRIFLGQPVQYGEKSFIRLAIGSYSVRKQLAKKQFDPTNDLQIIALIERAVKHLFEA